MLRPSPKERLTMRKPWTWLIFACSCKVFCWYATQETSIGWIELPEIPAYDYVQSSEGSSLSARQFLRSDISDNFTQIHIDLRKEF
jgi:hypothetical protein